MNQRKRDFFYWFERRFYAVCDTCRLRHRLDYQHDERFYDFVLRHVGHNVRRMSMLGVWDDLWMKLAWLQYAPNADVKQAFGSSTGQTQTLASLAQAAAREGTSVDNATNLFLDVFDYHACALQTGTPASDKAIYIYVYGSEDGTNYTDNATGTDAAVTLRSPTNLKLINVIATPDAGALTYKSHPASVAAAFGGVMPRKWGSVVENKTNLTLSATEGSHTKTYSGVFTTVI